MVSDVYFKDLRSMYLQGTLVDSAGDGLVVNEGLLLDDAELLTRLGSKDSCDLVLRFSDGLYYLEGGHDIFATLLTGYQLHPLDSFYIGLVLRVEYR